LLVDLERAPGLGIRRSLKPDSLPSDAHAYLAPAQRVNYFERWVDPLMQGALGMSLREWRPLLDSMLDAVWAVDPTSLCIVEVNAQAAALMGLPREACLGKAVVDFTGTPEDVFLGGRGGRPGLGYPLQHLAAQRRWRVDSCGAQGHAHLHPSG